jgi:hypothetical protein
MRNALALAVAAVALPACAAPRKPPDTPGNTTTRPAGPTASGPIGTDGPIVIDASDPDGRWVVACQARTDTNGDGKVGVNVGLHGDTYGDEMKPYLIVGDGAGEPIDAFVDQSADGAWLAALVGDQLVLIDGRTGARTPLVDADTRDDSYPTLAPRAAAFAGSTRVVFMRHRDTGDVVVSRELATGRETEVAVPGALWRIEPDAAGTWVRVVTVRRDTDKSGALEWPSQHTSLSDRGCRGPITSYGTYGASGDEPDLLWAGFDGAGVVDDATIVSVAGDALVRIGADKSLMIGDRAALPAGCDPILRGTLPDPPRVLAGCGATKAKLVVVGADGVKRDLGVDAERSDRIIRLGPADRLACIDDALCVDIVSGAVIKDELIYADGDRVLVRKADDRYAVVEAGAGETDLGKIDGYPSAVAGPIVAIGAVIVDLAAKRIAGRVDGDVAAVDRAGRALVTLAGVREDGEGPSLPVGPGRWIVPK